MPNKKKRVAELTPEQLETRRRKVRDRVRAHRERKKQEQERAEAQSRLEQGDTTALIPTLNRIPRSQVDIVVLHAMGMPYDQIAESVGIPVDLVRSTVEARLEEMIKNQHIDVDRERSLQLILVKHLLGQWGPIAHTSADGLRLTIRLMERWAKLRALDPARKYDHRHTTEPYIPGSAEPRPVGAGSTAPPADESGGAPAPNVISLDHHR